MTSDGRKIELPSSYPRWDISSKFDGRGSVDGMKMTKRVEGKKENQKIERREAASASCN